MKFRLTPVIVALGAACSSNSAVQSTDVPSYSNLAKCWQRNGEFKSYVVLHSERGKYFPYFISPWCDVKTGDNLNGRGFLKYIKALKFMGDDGVLMRTSFLDRPLESTTPVHSPLPVENDPVYTLVGNVERFENDGFIFYKVSSAKSFDRTDLVLNDLVKMTPDARLHWFVKQVN